MKHKLEKLLLGIAFGKLAYGIYRIYTHYRCMSNMTNEQERVFLTNLSSPESYIEDKFDYGKVCG